mmetsp:Transcript_23197/g.50708  ORF Transcript_23197/g.50708 Transcript_23197/m.50708 type:complete len:294 (-) Transcript_23197:1188-2069(-)
MRQDVDQHHDLVVFPFQWVVDLVGQVTQAVRNVLPPGTTILQVWNAQDRKDQATHDQVGRGLVVPVRGDQLLGYGQGHLDLEGTPVPPYIQLHRVRGKFGLDVAGKGNPLPSVSPKGNVAVACHGDSVNGQNDVVFSQDVLGGTGRVAAPDRDTALCVVVAFVAVASFFLLFVAAVIISIPLGQLQIVSHGFVFQPRIAHPQTNDAGMLPVLAYVFQKVQNDRYRNHVPNVLGVLQRLKGNTDHLSGGCIDDRSTAVPPVDGGIDLDGQQVGTGALGVFRRFDAGNDALGDAE